jgi:hypothetical protein
MTADTSRPKRTMSHPLGRRMQPGNHLCLCAASSSDRKAVLPRSYAKQPVVVVAAAHVACPSQQYTADSKHDRAQHREQRSFDGVEPSLELRYWLAAM